MLTADQAAALRADVKAAEEGSAAHVAYHAGDGQNKHERWAPVIDKDGKPVMDGRVERGEIADVVVTDAGGDIDALAAYYNEPGKATIWTRVSLAAVRRALLAQIRKLDAGQSMALSNFITLADPMLDFGDPDVRDALGAILAGEALDNLLALGKVTSTRLQDLCLLPEDGSGARTCTAPAVITRADVFDALYEQLGPDVVKR